MELAVNIPEQEPQVGQAERSYSSAISSDADGSAAMTMASTKSSLCSDSLVLPASMGPPETKIAGIFSRSAAINIPGVILSQLEIHTSASAQWAFDHVFDGVGNNIAGGQRIEHAVVAHGDTIVHGNSIEFAADTASFGDFFTDQLAHVFQVYVPWNKLGEGVGDSNDGFMKVIIFHTGGAP